jgi:hypothetical protein
MQHHYRPTSFAFWTKRLQQLRPGMTEEQVMQVLRPKALAWQLLPHNDIILLNDAYFANVFFDERTKRMISATSPLAITYELKPAVAAGFNLDSVSRVEVFRLAPLSDQHWHSAERFRDAKLVSGPKVLSVVDASVAIRELESMYSSESPQAYCIFAPRYGLRFELPTGTLDVLISPHCDEVHLIMDRASSRVSRQATMPKRSPEFMQVLKRMFPDHPLRDDEA